LLAGVAHSWRWTLSLLSLDSFGGFAHYSHCICSLDSLPGLSLDSFTGVSMYSRAGLAGFAREVLARFSHRPLIIEFSGGMLVGATRQILLPDSHTELSLDSFAGLSLRLLMGYARWMLSIYCSVYKLCIPY
jgi:hypothetical protein